jgi:hypothetical protein
MTGLYRDHATRPDRTPIILPQVATLDPLPFQYTAQSISLGTKAISLAIEPAAPIVGARGLAPFHSEEDLIRAANGLYRGRFVPDPDFWSVLWIAADDAQPNDLVLHTKAVHQ